MPEPPKSPPRLSLKIIRLWCSDVLYEEIEGNLYEFYSANASDSNFKSKFRFWYEVLHYLRPSTFKSVRKFYPTAMFNFNPKLTFRNLWQHRATTAISLGGFVLGLISVLYLYFYVQSEMKFDTFHKEGDKIYRAIRVGNLNGTLYDIGVTSGPYAEGLRTDFPESVQTTCRAYPQEGLVSFKDKVFYEEKLLNRIEVASENTSFTYYFTYTKG